MPKGMPYFLSKKLSSKQSVKNVYWNLLGSLFGATILFQRRIYLLTTLLAVHWFDNDALFAITVNKPKMPLKVYISVVKQYIPSLAKDRVWLQVLQSLCKKLTRLIVII